MVTFATSPKALTRLGWCTNEESGANLPEFRSGLKKLVQLHTNGIELQAEMTTLNRVHLLKQVRLSVPGKR